MALDHVAVIKFHGHLVFMILILWLNAALLMVMSSSYNVSKPGCRDRCGDISIPYPFGFGDENCFFDESFNITCNETFNPPKASLYVSDLELLDIDLHGQFRSNVPIASDCYDKNGNQTTGSISSFMFSVGRFSLSDTRNKMVAIGCDTVAYIRGAGNTSVCISFCNSINDVLNGSCTGRGCCQSPIPSTGQRAYSIELTAKYNHNESYFTFGLVFLLE